MARPASYLLTFLHLLICFSCATKPSPVPEISGGTNGGGDTRVYTDGIGRQVTLPKHPLRIVSLAPSVTEVISLVGADERLIGVTTHCDWPESVRTKPKLGDLINPNYELLLTAKPDLVIASTAGNDRTAVLKLADLGLPVFVTAPRSVDKILETVTQIGRITDCAAQGDALASRMKARLDDINAGWPGLRRCVHSSSPGSIPCLRRARKHSRTTCSGLPVSRRSRPISTSSIRATAWNRCWRAIPM